jgi:hypothetical protein
VCWTALAVPSLAWIYPEHRDIAGDAVRGLDPGSRQVLDRLWQEARVGHEDRLCAEPFAGDQGPKPACIDWAAWSAIAGDHSCSPVDMLATVLESPWILDVAAVAAKTKALLASTDREDRKQNRLTRSDLDLERADPRYSSRAGANNSHFLLPGFGSDPVAYGQRCIAEGSELNGVGIALWYHLEALRDAADLNGADLSSADRSRIALKALAEEAYAQHFLEDAFAAGHVAGTWGDVAQRKGTHDYYNVQGLATQTWKGESVVLMGDAHMRAEDLERASRLVRESLEQVLQVASGGEESRAAAALPPVTGPPLDTCKALYQPAVTLPPELVPLVRAISRDLPRPALGPGPGSLPRFRAEIGPFFGLASAARGMFASGGFESDEGHARAVGSLEIAARVGLGLDALIGDAGDGLVFVQAGLLYESKQPSACAACSENAEGLFPRVPARQGLSLRARVPFYLIPGDLVLATPLLLFTSPETLKTMAIKAANGGVIPWQTGLETPVGRWQIVAGREAGVTLFGYVGGPDSFLTVAGTGTDGRPIVVPVSVKSLEIDFPLIEHRPFRDFATRQAFTFLVQAGLGVSVPTRVDVLVEGLPAPALKKSYFGYIRLSFDWRRYL